MIGVLVTPEVARRLLEVPGGATIRTYLALLLEGEGGVYTGDMVQLAERAGISDGAARRAVRDLERLDLAQRVQRYRDDGGRDTNEIRAHQPDAHEGELVQGCAELTETVHAEPAGAPAGSLAELVAQLRRDLEQVRADRDEWKERHRADAADLRADRDAWREIACARQARPAEDR